MELNEERLKEIYRRGTARAGQGQGCLTREQFALVAAGRMSRKERLAAARHMASCFDCAEEYRILRSLEFLRHEAEQPEAARSVAPRFPGRAFSTPARRAVAAAMVMIIAVAAFLIFKATRPLTPAPGASRGGVALQLEVAPGNGETISDAPQRLTWSEAEGTLEYQVILYDFESTPVWESPPVKTSFVVIPEEVRASLKRARPTYWRVTALRGVERQRSELFQFTIH
jgi:hypothetical protein